MDVMLEHFRVIAERETGFWLTLPVSTGISVSRDRWLELNQVDPDHFQILELAPGPQSSSESTSDGVIIEKALFVTWSDETLH